MSREVRTINTDVWQWPAIIPPDAEVEDDPLLYAKDVSELVKFSARTWNRYVQTGIAPPADDPDAGRPANKRMPRWRTSRVRYFMENRVGRGRRADLLRARKSEAAA